MIYNPLKITASRLPRCIFYRETNEMPKVFEWNGYRFFFFSNEGIPREPCHVHIRKGGQYAKFWVNPYVSLASSYEMTAGAAAP
jgi:hypothetical protein